MFPYKGRGGRTVPEGQTLAVKVLCVAHVLMVAAVLVHDELKVPVPPRQHARLQGPLEDGPRPQRLQAVSRFWGKNTQTRV